MIIHLHTDWKSLGCSLILAKPMKAIYAYVSVHVLFWNLEIYWYK